MILYTPDTSDVGSRLDAYLARVTGESRSAAVRAIDEGRVKISGATVTKKYAIRAGDVIEYEEETVEEYEAAPENIPLDVVYEDSDIIVINKPEGMVVHPAAGNLSGTLVNALLYHCRDLSGIGGVMRPGIVHRIDKDTSGLLVCAKNDFSHRALAEELEHHGIVREYHALVQGGFRDTSGTVDLPIGRSTSDRKKMAVHTSPTAHAKRAVTHYEVLGTYFSAGTRISHLKLVLETGRTHQIRVHMSYTGHALLGDTTYGGGKTQFEKLHANLLSGQALHAMRLSLTHPRTKERMTFTSALPRDFEKLLDILENSDGK